MKKFFCNFCGHVHTLDEVILSVLLRGFATLIGTDGGAFGISCIHPECGKTFFTLTNESEFDWIVKRIITNPSVTCSLDKKQPEEATANIAYTTYRYHVPSYYFEKDNHIFSSFDVHYENVQVIENTDALVEDYWCSYRPGLISPLQPQSMAIWFKKEDLMSLLAIENFHAERVFPRCIPINSQYEKAEQLSFSQNFSFKCDSGINIDTGINGIDPDLILARQHKLSPAMGNFIIGNLKYTGTSIMPEDRTAHYFINELGNAGNQVFLEILTSELPILGNTGIDPFSIFMEKALKVDNPYLDYSRSFTLTNIDYDKIENPDDEAEHTAMVKKIRENSTTQAVQDWLTDNIDEFIVDYERITAYAGFSYAEFWRIIKRHVKRLSFHLDIELRKVAKYAFYKEGEYFTIIFNASTPVRIKEQIGLKYIHYLVLNKHEFIRSRALENLGGIEVFNDENEMEDDDNDLQFREGKSEEFDVYDTTEYENLSIRADVDGLPDYKIDKKAITATLNMIKELKTQKKAEKDSRRKADIQKDIDILNNYLGESTANKKPQPFSTVSKKKKTKIGNSIKNSLKSLDDSKKDGGKPIADHFKKFLSSLYSDQLRYSPTPDIDWHT